MSSVGYMYNMNRVWSIGFSEPSGVSTSNMLLDPCLISEGPKSRVIKIEQTYLGRLSRSCNNNKDLYTFLRCSMDFKKILEGRFFNFFTKNVINI